MALTPLSLGRNPQVDGEPIRIALSTDRGGMKWNATLISSILRRTSRKVDVVLYTREFAAESFCKENLSVTFVGVDEPVTGRYPGHVPFAVFDRLRVIRDWPEWDRALILDHDMLVLCDLGPYFDEDFGDSLLMARLFGAGNTLGLQMRPRGGLPPAFAHAEDYPYFFMGPMLNLKAMRVEGIWEQLLRAHNAIGEDEQISLTAATGGRVKGVERKWNIVPQWDGLAEANVGDIPLDGRVGHFDWINGCPMGIIHWTGPAKPWHYQSRVWRADLWESERSSWQQLRMGLWRKPKALIINPGPKFSESHLAVRGWEVGVMDKTGSYEEIAQYPDTTSVSSDSTVERWVNESQMVRIGPGGEIDGGLIVEPLPATLLVDGPRSASEVDSLRKKGFVYEFRYFENSWPTGGPDPSVLEFWRASEARPISMNEVVVFSKEGRNESAPPGINNGEVSSNFPDYQLFGFILNEINGLIGSACRIAELGYGRVFPYLRKALPESRITVFTEDARVAEAVKQIGRDGGIHAVHTPLSKELKWYEFSDSDSLDLDLLIVDGPDQQPDQRRLAAGLCRMLKEGAFVILCGTNRAGPRAALPDWQEMGCHVVVEGFDYIVLRSSLPTTSGVVVPEETANLESVPLVVISSDLDKIHRWQLPFDEDPLEVVDAIRPHEAEISWARVRHFHAEGLVENLQGDYVIQELQRIDAFKKALKVLLDSEFECILIQEGRVEWSSAASARISRLFVRSRDRFDVLILHCEHVTRCKPVGDEMIRLRQFGRCRAAIWTRRAAEAMLQRIDEDRAEIHVSLQKLSHSWRVLAPTPFPAR